MHTGNDRPPRRIYTGVWAILSGLFRVPESPPTLPAKPGARVERFRPAAGFLRYLKLKFWLLLTLIDGLLLAGWVLLWLRSAVAAIALAPVVVVAVVLPDLVAYVALHLRFDTTWYVLSDRSLRIRRGIWLLRETTITFENVQNVAVKQGPLERHFGIANLVVETAGGGGGSDDEWENPGPSVGCIEGVDDAARIRDLILERVRRSRSAGLGDDATGDGGRAAWNEAHVACLRDIRDEIAAL